MNVEIFRILGIHTAQLLSGFRRWIPTRPDPRSPSLIRGGVTRSHILQSRFIRADPRQKLRQRRTDRRTQVDVGRQNPQVQRLRRAFHLYCRRAGILRSKRVSERTGSLRTLPAGEEKEPIRLKRSSLPRAPTGQKRAFSIRQSEITYFGFRTSDLSSIALAKEDFGFNYCHRSNSLHAFEAAAAASSLGLTPIARARPSAISGR